MDDGTGRARVDPAAILEAQKAAFLADHVPDLAGRCERLGRLRAALRDNRSAFVRASAEDFGRRAEETLILDLGQAVQGIGYLSRNLRRWMRPERRAVPLPLWPGRARVIRQPKGVIGIMAPWNYPYMLSLVPLATAIAGGNRAMLKPSELAPASAGAMARVLSATFPATEVAVVEGGPETGAAFAALPFDHLFFTGSTAVGRKVMRAAAENLVPVTLELGGKSPVILDRDADFAKAARDLAFGKIANAGQTCIAPDHVLVHEDDLDGFAEQVVAALARADPGRARMTRIIEGPKAGRLRAMLAAARAAGAEVRAIGAAGTGEEVAPAVVLRPDPESALMREEIFGPLLPIVPYADLDAVLAGVAAGPKPLALYFYGGAEGRKRLLRRGLAGGVTINGVMTHIAVDSLPFGGIGTSGIGAYHGREGFEAMTHAQAVYEEPKRSLIPLGRPGGRFERLFARYLMW